MLGILLLSLVNYQSAIPVSLKSEQSGWQLYRDGKPYYVKGVGGNERYSLLSSLGGNSMRTWGAENLRPQLDEAHRNGISVTIGIWLGHKHHGFNYDDPKQVKEQFEKAKAFVLEYKDHPAVLFWGLGNEMEMNDDRPELWKAVNDIAKMVKQLDPNHPTMTVVAEIGGDKLKHIKQYAPDVDILGINSYGGLSSLPKRLKDAGWTRPYVITEFGPLGPWEVPKTPWGAPQEPTSSEKAELYLSNYKNSIEGQKGQCLGSYAFLWGEKQETTPTWFGLFLRSGEITEQLDAMSYAWKGQWPENRAPHTERISLSGSNEVKPGSNISATVLAKDREGNPLSYAWSLKKELGEYKYAGEGEQTPESLESEVKDQNSNKVTFKAPTQEGPYRLYVIIRDGKGKAATANLPFLVKK